MNLIAIFQLYLKCRDAVLIYFNISFTYLIVWTSPCPALVITFAKECVYDHETICHSKVDQVLASLVISLNSVILVHSSLFSKFEAPLVSAGSWGSPIHHTGDATGRGWVNTKDHACNKLLLFSPWCSPWSKNLLAIYGHCFNVLLYSISSVS